jgi:hypothetical protein
MQQPVIVIDTDSTATEQIRLYPMTRQAMVFWRSGHYSNHTVRRRDMLRLLLNLKQSAGQWVNRCALA